LSAAPKILLVEDELAAAEAVGYLLQLNGFQVTTAADGREAVQSLELSRPDLVLSDVMMPLMDGFDLVRHIRGDPELRDLPVVLMSAAHNILTTASGASAVLTKPLDFNRLLALVRGLLGAAAPDAGG
jgi:CheY-like chemotaxis protein